MSNKLIAGVETQGAYEKDWWVRSYIFSCVNDSQNHEVQIYSSSSAWNSTVSFKVKCSTLDKIRNKN